MDLSTITEPQIVVSKDGKSAIKYTVQQEKIDLEALRREKEELEAQLKKPSDNELLEVGKSHHEFYTRGIEDIQKRIDWINSLLEK